jgi:hypothetical protein
VVFFNIGPVTPFTEYGLFDSVRKPRPNKKFQGLLINPEKICWFIMPTGLLLMDDLEAAWPWQRANPTFSLLPRA